MFKTNSFKFTGYSNYNNENKRVDSHCFMHKNRWKFWYAEWVSTGTSRVVRILRISTVSSILSFLAKVYPKLFFYLVSFSPRAFFFSFQNVNPKGEPFERWCSAHSAKCITSVLYFNVLYSTRCRGHKGINRISTKSKWPHYQTSSVLYRGQLSGSTLILSVYILSKLW